MLWRGTGFPIGVGNDSSANGGVACHPNALNGLSFLPRRADPAEITETAIITGRGGEIG